MYEDGTVTTPIVNFTINKGGNVLNDTGKKGNVSIEGSYSLNNTLRSHLHYWKSPSSKKIRGGAGSDR